MVRFASAWNCLYGDDEEFNGLLIENCVVIEVKKASHSVVRWRQDGKF